MSRSSSLKIVDVTLPISLTSLELILSSAITSISSNNGIHISNDDLATTLTSSITTATTSGGPEVHVHAAAARDYVTSMSVEERDDLLLQLDERIAELSFEENEKPKVKSLGTIDNRSMFDNPYKLIALQTIKNDDGSIKYKANQTISTVKWESSIHKYDGKEFKNM